MKKRARPKRAPEASRRPENLEDAPSFGPDRHLAQELLTADLISYLLADGTRADQRIALRDELNRRVARPVRCEHYPHSSQDRICVVCGRHSDRGNWIY